PGIKMARRSSRLNAQKDLLTTLSNEVIQRIQSNLFIRDRIKSRSINEIWNMNTLKTLELEQELALKFGTGKAKFKYQNSFPYMDVQANQSALLVNNKYDETGTSVFDHNVPYTLAVSKRIRERVAPKFAAMFPSVKIL